MTTPNPLFCAPPAVRGAFALALIGALSAFGQTTGVPTYTFVDLGPAVLGQGIPRLIGKGTAAYGINDSRVVVGDGDLDEVGWRYSAGTTTQVITGGSALDINNAGVIVGARTGAAVRVENGTVQSIVSTAGRFAVARRISNAGHIVGEVSFFQNNTDIVQGFLWYQGTTTMIGPDNGNTEATGVNDRGEVSGITVRPGASDGTAFLWRNGTFTFLTAGFSRADDINNNGVIVGNGDADGPFRYANGTLTRLGRLAGFDRLQPAAINDAGVIVGTAENESQFRRVAVVWINDQARDLNSLVTVPAGRVLASATAINTNGDIVGFDDKGNAFLLQAASAPPPPSANPGRIVNMSILTAVGAAGESFTVGTVIGGSGTTGTKPLLVRAVGPSLAAFGVSGALDDPKLELFTGTAKVGENDNWGGSAALAAASAQVGAFALAGPASRDAVLLAPALGAGGHSAVISGVGASSGPVILELYDASAPFTATTPRLVNVSVLKNLGTGLTAGFVIGGATGKTVLVRAVGPGLAPFGVTTAVGNPQLALYSGTTKIGENDNWGGTAALKAAFSAVAAFVLPDGSQDAAVLATLQPGSYTVQVSGVGGTTGTALVEVYEVP